MELRELKQEAKRQGYYLLKAQKYEKLLPCTCGFKRRTTRYCKLNNGVGVLLECQRCGKKTVPTETYDSARKEWNAMTKREEKTRGKK